MNSLYFSKIIIGSIPCEKHVTYLNVEQEAQFRSLVLPPFRRLARGR
jgi:hypothetical protein